MFFRWKKKAAIQKDGSQGVEIKVPKEVIKEREKMIKSVMEQKKLPILVVDKNWYGVKEIVGNDGIHEKEKQLLEYLKEQGSLTNTIKENQAVKQNLMKKVLEVSEAVNNKGDTNKNTELNTLHLALTKLNEDLPEQEARLEEVERLVEEANRELTKEIVTLSYTYMESYKATSKSLGEEIHTLRQQLLEKANEKKKYDKQTSTLYHYLHNVVGYKHIDKLDAKLGEFKK